MTRNANIRSMEQLLESDDEFPDEYDDEIPDIPAYKLDSRFESTECIDFPWIENSTEIKYCGTNPDVQPSICSNSIEEVQPPKKNGRPMLNINIKEQNEKQHEQSLDHEKQTDKSLLKKGVLSKQDIFCLQCIGAVATDTTLIWFINFLMSKDLQSNYKFLKSCLVMDDLDDTSSKREKLVGEVDIKKFNFNIVVKV